jgi:hypothetical protein
MPAFAVFVIQFLNFGQQTVPPYTESMVVKKLGGRVVWNGRLLHDFRHYLPFSEKDRMVSLNIVPRIFTPDDVSMFSAETRSSSASNSKVGLGS